MEKKGSLEIDENYAHHVRAWRLKRVSWIIMTLLLIAALAGLLGPGPASSSRSRGQGDVRATYEKRIRHKAQTRMELTIPGGSGDLELSVNVDFLNKIELKDIEPEPAEARLAGPNHTWVFPRSNEPGTILLSFEPEDFGKLQAIFDVKGAGSMVINQFVFP